MVADLIFFRFSWKQVLVLGGISRKVNLRVIPQKSGPVENISLFCGEKMNCPKAPP